MAASGLVAVVVAGLVVTTTDGPVVGVSALPGATAEPTGPTGGPGGDGGLNGGQFQPPQMPSPPGGYNGGSYPQPGQSDYGVDINSPAAQAPEYSQAPQYPQQAGPQQQQPAHGTQPPNYDAPLQQQPSAAQQPSAPQTADPQQSDNTQEPSQQQDSQQLNQKQQQCQAAAAQLAAGFLPTGIFGGGGRGPVLGIGPWKLDPAKPTPTPPCPGGCPSTAQPQPPAGNQPPATLTPEQLQQIQKDAYDQGRKDASKCDGFTKFENIFGLVGSSLGVVVSVAGAPFSGGQSLWGIIPSFAGMFATWDNLRKCSN